MNDDLISRQAARHALGNVIAEGITPQEVVINYKDIVLGRIEALPSADAQPIRHGKWLHCDDGSLSWRCSVCGKHAYGNYAEVFSGEYHFCPYCGARMDDEDRWWR